jgi:hypothetical protein
VLPGVAAADQGLGLRQEVLLADLHAFPESGGRGLVQDAYSAAGLRVDLYAVEPRAGFAGSRAGSCVITIKRQRD